MPANRQTIVQKDSESERSPRIEWADANNSRATQKLGSSFAMKDLFRQCDTAISRNESGSS